LSGRTASERIPGAGRRRTATIHVIAARASTQQERTIAVRRRGELGPTGAERWGGGVGVGDYLGDEAVTGGGDGLEEAWLTAILVESLAEKANGASERVLGDGSIAPNGTEQFLFADETAAVLDEIEEQAERFGLKRYGYAVRSEAEGGVVGLKAIEAVDHRRTPWPFTFRAPFAGVTIMGWIATYLRKNHSFVRVPSRHRVIGFGMIASSVPAKSSHRQ
jgi:hypothetical protein